MSRYYQACFGLVTVDDAEDDYCIMESEEWSLAIVRIPDEIARTIHLSDPPDRRSDTPVKLSFEVHSIEGLRASMSHYGGRIDPEDQEWSFRGFVHCDVIDPEGNVVQLREARGPAEPVS